MQRLSSVFNFQYRNQGIVANIWVPDYQNISKRKPNEPPSGFFVSHVFFFFGSPSLHDKV